MVSMLLFYHIFAAFSIKITADNYFVSSLNSLYPKRYKELLLYAGKNSAARLIAKH